MFSGQLLYEKEPAVWEEQQESDENGCERDREQL